MTLMRVAYVHDWLVTYRGGEKVLEALAELYPDAPIYTLFYDPQNLPSTLTSRDIRTPRFWASLRRGRKLLLPLLPQAIESLDFSGFDLVISTSSCVAKGAIKPPGAKHLCYIHSPMRYAWDQMEEYIAGVRHIPGAAWAIRKMVPRLRRWDQASASRVDHFVANSTFVRHRVQKYYNRDASVVHPPIDLDRFTPKGPTTQRGGYWLACGALVSYKRFDLAIGAAERLGRPLIVAGSGPMEGALRRIAGRWTTFEIAPSDQRMNELMAGAEALLFPGVEDFGMIAVEAMASGTPVIALSEGGAKDFIVPGVTGVFFSDASIDALATVLTDFKPSQFDWTVIRKCAERFGKDSFLNQIKTEIRLLFDQGSMR